MSPHSELDHAEPVSSNGPASLSQVVKFTALASLLAIFIDAAIGHAMIWGNDPYWTYWVTDTLLMATVFGLGTMIFGIGIGRGALITAVHVTLLTTYYWSLSPIGLPSHPEWLDLEHTWITGLPVHLGVYYLGYLGAFWLWTRHSAAKSQRDKPPERALAQIGAAALVVSAAVVIIAGLAQTVVLNEFPGITWFVMRIAVAVPFTVAWWMLAGNGRSGAVVGGIVFALLLTTYGHYLSPAGLPSDPARLLAENSPSADVHWLSYRQQFMVMLPLSALLAAIAYLLAARWLRLHPDYHEPVSRMAFLSGAAAAVVLAIVGILAAPHLGPQANRAVVTSIGTGSLTTDNDSQRDSRAISASLRMTVENRNTHKTPLPPHDRIDLAASVTGADGSPYEIRATQPMVADPAGRFTTWYGIGFGKWHDGRSGIGLSSLPPTRSNVVAFALGTVTARGRIVATGVPIQVAATTGRRRLLNLHVGDRDSPLPGTFDVTWQDFDGGYSGSSKYARYLFGGGVLLVLLGLTFAAARRQQAAKDRPGVAPASNSADLSSDFGA
ncbi:MAG TPA: hypothetical protein VFZ91_03095 [Allosphingosinicella sp.]